MNCENCANAYDEGYTAGHNAENARLRQYAQSGAATFEDLYVRDREIARLREQAEALAEALEETNEQLERDFAIRCRCDFVTRLWAGIERCVGCRARERIAAIDAALRAYREPGSPAIRPIHTKYLDDQLDERCITCLERWPCKEASHE